MSNIKIQDILKKHKSLYDTVWEDNGYLLQQAIMEAIKEIVEDVVDKCAKNAKVKCLNIENDCTGKNESCSECEYHIKDKQSILQVKQMINYE